MAAPKIIVVGGGLAGLAAVIKIAEMGGEVDLFSIVPVKRSHSVCAQGGINAAKNLKGEGDSTWQHFDDTIYGGDFLANQPPVKAMCDAAPGIIDLLDRMGVTIDLQRKVAVLNLAPADSKARFDEMETAMHHCNIAFNQAKPSELEDCFDPEIVLYTQHGEFRGRKQVMQYLNEQYFKDAKDLRFEMSPHDIRSFGDALWYSYDYSMDKGSEHRAGHGVAMCRRQEGKWRILNMHNALVEPASGSKQ